MGLRSQHRTVLILLAIGLVFFIVSFAAPRWFSGTDKHPDIYFGLWQVCDISPELDGCRSISNYTSDPWVEACQGFQTTTLVLTLFSLVTSMVLLFSMKKPIAYVAASLSTIAGVLGFAGAMNFFSQQITNQDATAETDWAIYMNLGADVLIFVAGLTLFQMAPAIKPPQDKGYQKMPGPSFG